MLKVCFVYLKGHYFLTGQHFDNVYYRFFFEGMPQSKRIKYAINEPGDYDVLVLFNEFAPDWVAKADAVKIAVCGDAHSLSPKKLDAWRETGVKHTFFQFPEKYVRKFLPEEFGYEKIIFGMDKAYFPDVDFESRRKDKVLLTGTVGSAKCYDGKLRGSARYYNLRNKCRDAPGVEYVSFSKGSLYTGNNYGRLLNRYQAAIAASTQFVVHKYFELPMAGCLTFAEAGDSGIEEYEFIDGVNCIFIDDDNFTERIAEYLEDTDNSRWARIASAGREMVFRYYSQDVQVNKLVDYMEKIR